MFMRLSQLWFQLFLMQKLLPNPPSCRLITTQKPMYLVLPLWGPRACLVSQNMLCAVFWMTFVVSFPFHHCSLWPFSPSFLQYSVKRHYPSPCWLCWLPHKCLIHLWWKKGRKEENYRMLPRSMESGRVKITWWICQLWVLVSTGPCDISISILVAESFPSFKAT